MGIITIQYGHTEIQMHTTIIRYNQYLSANLYVNKNSQLQGSSPGTYTSNLPGPAGEPGKLARYR